MLSGDNTSTSSHWPFREQLALPPSNFSQGAQHFRSLHEEVNDTYPQGAFGEESSNLDLGTHEHVTLPPVLLKWAWRGAQIRTGHPFEMVNWQWENCSKALEPRFVANKKVNRLVPRECDSIERWHISTTCVSTSG